MRLKSQGGLSGRNRDMKVRRRPASAAVFVCGSLGAVAATFAALLATPATATAQPAAGPAAGPHAGLATARVVFCGDSITGQGGGWLGAGYCFQMEWALKQRHPDATPKLVALGGSGMGVGNWIGVETRLVSAAREGVAGKGAPQGHGDLHDHDVYGSPLVL